MSCHVTHVIVLENCRNSVSVGGDLTGLLTGGGVGDEAVDGALALRRPLLLDALVERHLTHDSVQLRPVAGLEMLDLGPHISLLCSIKYACLS